MRGEDVRLVVDADQEEGSPPHARGRRSSTRWANFTKWITPACAGKTTMAINDAENSSDHPRMRGED